MGMVFSICQKDPPHSSRKSDLYVASQNMFTDYGIEISPRPSNEDKAS